MKMLPLLLALMCGVVATTELRGAEEWQLSWSDEFDYEGLPDPTKWGYEEGFVRNHEAQYYTKARRENARVENGRLILEARKEHWVNPGYKEGSSNESEKRAFAEYTSASINTQQKESPLYGRMEMRAKLPQGKGVWPAFWTLGANIGSVGWPRCGEIDVMEFVGHNAGIIYGTLHWAGGGGKHESSQGKTNVANLGNAFHVYAVNWDPARIEFFVDDQKFHTVELGRAGEGEENAFHKPQYILLNLALGGSWGGAIDESALPQQMLVDYVRVYKK